MPERGPLNTQYAAENFYIFQPEHFFSSPCFSLFSFYLFFFTRISTTLMAAYGAYPVMAGAAYPPRPTPYLVSPSPYYPQAPMAYGQPGKLHFLA